MKHKKSLVTKNKWSFKRMSFFNAVSYNFKNTVIETFRTFLTENYMIKTNCIFNV